MDEGHTVTIRLKGFSMRPFLEDERDKALLAKAESVKVGDVVLAEVSPRHYVLHRLINLDNDIATLRGDGNIRPEYCKKSDIKAVALGFYRKGRKKMDRTDGKKWLIYSLIWTHLYPIRRYLLAFHRAILFKL